MLLLGPLKTALRACGFYAMGNDSPTWLVIHLYFAAFSITLPPGGSETTHMLPCNFSHFSINGKKKKIPLGIPLKQSLKTKVLMEK